MSCHALCRRVSNRIEPELATASRDLGMNGATVRKDAGGAWPASALPGRSSRIARTAPAKRRRPQHRSCDPAITARKPEHRAACQHAHACGRQHTRAPDALGSERRQVQSSQQLGATLGQPGGLAQNAPRFLPPDGKRQKTDCRILTRQGARGIKSNHHNKLERNLGSLAAHPETAGKRA